MKSPFQTIALVFTFLVISPLFSQNSKLIELEKQIAGKQEEIAALEAELERVKLGVYQKDLLEFGLPAQVESDELITHSLMALAYREDTEQARWVAHYLSPDIIRGSISRTNDFRIDEKVSTGSAVEADYFLKTAKEDGEFEYDGFGYDRGHLAPSADFRWSSTALSESYYYSNMSPQLPGFNREGWAALENDLRSYVFRNPSSYLLVVTGPVFLRDMKRIDRGVNKLAIPDAFFKVAYDPMLQKGIAFLVPHQEDLLPVENYILSIDSLERLVGLDFYPALEDGLENTVESEANAGDWIPELNSGDVLPISAPTLPRNHFNTLQAKQYSGNGETITVCGRVVSTKKTAKGAIFLNLDKRFPNQTFTVTIWKDDQINFSYDPSVALEGKDVCFTGKVSDFDGVPSMNVDREKAIKLYP